MKKKITIIGRGIIGLATAFELAQRGAEVEVMGSANTIGVASYAAVGISSIKGLRVAKDDFFRAKMAGHEQFTEFLRKVSKCSGLEIPIVKGVYEYFKDPNHYQNVRDRTYHGEFTGFLNCQIHNSDELSEYKLLSAHLKKSKLLGAFRFPGDLWFHPTALLKALELAVLKLGGKIKDEQVVRIVPHQDRGFRIEARGREYVCSQLVLACGEATPSLIKNISQIDFPFISISGQTLVSTCSNDVKETFRIGRKALNMYGSQLRYGSTDFPKNHIPTTEELESVKSELINELSEQFSLTVKHENTEYLWGTRLALKDRRPIIGKLPCVGNRALWISCGYHKSGFNLAGLAGEVLAEKLLGEQPDVDKFYSISRFR